MVAARTIPNPQSPFSSWCDNFLEGKALMNLKILGFGLLTFVIVAFASAFVQNAAPAEPAQALYAELCASCHPVDGRGAASLFDDQWRYGSNREQIAANIVNGIEDAGMPAFGEVLSGTQVSQLIEYIYSRRDSAADDTPTRQRRGETLDYNLRIEHWVGEEAGLQIPWAIDFLDSDTALVTERPGPIRVVTNGRLLPEPVANTPKVLHQGQGGMMDVAIDPEYSQNGWIYLGYTHALSDRSNAPAMTRIVRGRIVDHAWTNEEVLFEADHESYLPTRHHYGTRIVFDKEGFLFFAIGDRGRSEHAQDLSLPNGKVHRIHRDGRIPGDNPFVGRPDALPTIYSYGHRNPQGLAIDPDNGQLWALEHGPRGGDELNICRPGKNYGWPVITYGINYDGTIITTERRRDGMEQPVYYWNPSIAVCGLDFYQGAMFPYWNKHLIVSALVYEEVRILNVEGDRVMHEELILKDMGRVREAVTGPDGAIYAVVNEPDEILRISSLGPVRQ
jgi:aldose sugar dehydrogenase